MRMPVILFCFGCLILSVFIALHGNLFSPTSHGDISAASLSDVPPLLEKFVLRNNRPLKKESAAAFNEANLEDQIRTALNSGNPADEAEVFSVYFPTLIKANPWAAANFTESLDAGATRTDLMRVLAQTWAQMDLDGVTKWVAQLADPNERDTMLSCVCFKIAENDVAQAVQTLEQEGLNERRNVMLGNLVQQWATQDLPAAMNWADNCPSDEVRANLFKHIALAKPEIVPAHP